MYENILIPLDGSKAAEMVIPYAVQMAARLDSQLILTGVCDPSTSGTEQLYHAYLERIAKQVQNQLKDWKPKTEKQVQTKVFIGKPAEEILRYADANNVALIALTSFGSSGRSHWFLGNNVAKIIQATSKPLLLIRAPASNSALQQKRLLKKVLVPLDGSELGATAVPYAELLGQALGAEIVLFQALEPMRIPFVDQELTTPNSGYTPVESKKVDSLAYLNSVANRLNKWGLKVSSAVVLGYAADQIIDYAKANAIDLIAMSSHGRTGVGRWLYGSVTDKVLHAGDTPVLVIHPTTE